MNALERRQKSGRHRSKRVDNDLTRSEITRHIRVSGSRSNNHHVSSTLYQHSVFTHVKAFGLYFSNCLLQSQSAWNIGFFRLIGFIKTLDAFGARFICLFQEPNNPAILTIEIKPGRVFGCVKVK